MNVSATINGTVPIIESHQRVVFKDFTEIMRWKGPPQSRRGIEQAQAVTTGVGFRGNFGKAQFRSYMVEPCADPLDPVCEEEEGKGSTTTYTGLQPSTPVLRSARDITITYDAATRTMNVHLYNTVAPIEAAR